MGTGTIAVPESPHAGPAESRSASLDLLKVAAALAVVATHVQQHVFRDADWLLFGSVFAVPVFYVIAGFLLAGKGPVRVVRQAGRFLSAFLVGCALYLLLAWPAGSGPTALLLSMRGYGLLRILLLPPFGILLWYLSCGAAALLAIAALLRLGQERLLLPLGLLSYTVGTAGFRLDIAAIGGDTLSGHQAYFWCLPLLAFAFLSVGFRLPSAMALADGVPTATLGILAALAFAAMVAEQSLAAGSFPLFFSRYFSLPQALLAPLLVLLSLRFDGLRSGAVSLVARGTLWTYILHVPLILPAYGLVGHFSPAWLAALETGNPPAAAGIVVLVFAASLLPFLAYSGLRAASAAAFRRQPRTG